MSQNHTSDAAILNLDSEEIGNVLVRLGLLAHQLGHEEVTGTLNPYCNHPENLSAEARFVYDLFCRSTPEIIDRWYGGERDALVMIAHTTANLFEPDPA